MVVIGGGAIGLASAYRLAGDGRKVVVLDAGELGREASWAGGGILSPIHPWHYPGALVDLVARSTELYPALARELLEETGVSIELRNTGLLRLALTDDDEVELAEATTFRAARSLPVERPASARAHGTAITEEAKGALHEPDVAQVRNPRLLKALVAGCARRGVELAPHEPVIELLRNGERITGVRTARRTLSSGETVLAAGAWSSDLVRRALGLELGVEPVRGQMLLLEAPPGALDAMVIGCGGRYLIPRADGRVLVGSTLEHVGFDRRTTAGAVRSLLDAALRLAPGLASATLVRAWAGLRPSTPDRLPYIGRPAGVDGLVVATGHYRNGLVLTPVTGALVADLVAGRGPSVDLRPFAPARPR